MATDSYNTCIPGLVHLLHDCVGDDAILEVLTHEWWACHWGRGSDRQQPVLPVPCSSS